MATETFDPNRNSFAACVERIAVATERVGFSPDRKRIITSRDEGVPDVEKALEVDNVPDGFRKWQLPFYVDHPTHMFVTVAEPGAEAPAHSHKDGDGVRFIAGGSIVFDGKELSAGDWMYVPAGAEYSFTAGRFGAIMCYCYAC